MGYRPSSEVPFHNALHATDVMERTFCLLLHPLFDTFSGIELVALIVAAACHDLGHDGCNNKFHADTNSPLSQRYTSSPLENHHANLGWDLTSKFLLEALSPTDRVTFMTILTTSILGTDMARQHNIHVDELDSLQNVDFSEFKHRLQLLAILLHAADLSNLARPIEQAEFWIVQVFTEFFALGDKQKALGHELSVNCDRNDTCINNAEIGFITYFVLPLFQALREVIPDGDADVAHSFLELNLLSFSHKITTCPSTPLSDSGAWDVSDFPLDCVWDDVLIQVDDDHSVSL